MKDSTLIFSLSVFSFAAWIGVSAWLKRRNRAIGLPLGACFQTAVQVSLLLGVFTASVERFSSRTETEPLLDFAPLYAGGKLVLESPEDLYDPREQLRVEKESTQMPLQEKDLLPFPYPPFVAVALSVPASFDFSSAYRLFLLFNFASLLLTVYLLIRQLGLDQSRSQALVLLITAFFPVYLTLKQGQLSLIFGLLYTLFWLRLPRGNSSHSFWWAGLLTGKPPLLPVPVLTLATRQQWRPLVGLAGASLLLWGLPLLWTGPAVLSDYVRLLADIGSGRYETISRSAMCGLRGLDFWLGAGNLVWIPGTLLLLTALWITRRWTLNRWGRCTLILSTLVLAPHLYLHDLVLAVPAFALVLKELPVVRRTTFYLLFLLALLPVLTLSLGGSLGLPLPWLALPLSLCCAYSLTRWRRSV